MSKKPTEKDASREPEAPKELKITETSPEPGVTADTSVMQLAPANRPLIPYNSDPAKAKRMATSLQLSQPEGKKAAYNAITSQDLSAVAVRGQLLSVRDWLCHDVKLTNPDTGEISDCVRTVLITHDGKRIGCVSDGVLSSLMSIISVFGPAPWKPEMQLSIEEGMSSHKRRYYYLMVH